jgi:nitrile hydratase
VTARSAHDVGGLEGFGEVPRGEEEHVAWHESVMRLLFSSGRFGLSRVSGESRYLVETLDPDVYRSLGYYDRWVVAIAGLYSRLSPDATLSDDWAAVDPVSSAPSIDASDAPFAVGTTVAVVSVPPSGHHRLPAYTWGHHGVIRDVYAPQEVPGCPIDELRHEYVYNVAFSSGELWGDDGEDEFRIDLFACYLSTTEKDG